MADTERVPGTPHEIALLAGGHAPPSRSPS